jgi:amino acid adenylation domain-containing protein
MNTMDTMTTSNAEMNGAEEEAADRVEQIYPLSPLQEGMLFHTLYQAGPDIYVGQLICSLHGPLDRPAFARAWQKVIDRHGVLRTAFVYQGLDRPLQVVCRDVTLRLDYQDWRAAGPDEQARRLDAYIRADQKQGYSLVEPPLMRLALIQVADQEHRFIWSHHHILLDGWSCSIVLKEAIQLYEACSRALELELEEAPLYRDFIGWLERQQESEAERYWRDMLRGVTTPTRLSIDRQPGRPSGEAWDYQTEQVWLSEATTDELRALGKKHQLTLNTMVQGAWAALVSRYSREQDVIFGVTVSGRGADVRGIERIVGLMINTVPLRVKVRGEAPLIEWLKQMQADQFEAREYEHTPLVKIKQWSQMGVGEQMFDSLVVFENQPLDRYVVEQTRGAGGLRVEGVSVEQRTNYGLTIIVEPGERMSIKLIYDKQRYGREQARRMAGHLRRLLEEMATGEGKRVSELEMLSEEELAQQVEEWNEASAGSEQAVECIHEMFEYQVERSPDATAVIFGDRQLTYAELNSRANRLARYLKGCNVGPDVTVAICVDRSLEMVIGMLAVLKAGGAYVPLDPAYPKDRIEFMLQDAGAPVLLAQRHLAESLPITPARVLCLDSDSEEIREISRQPSSNLSSDTTPDNLAYVIYTSGSTGRPKGVSVPHRGVIRLVKRPNYVELSAEHTLLQLCSTSFDVSTFEIWGALLNGGRLAVAPPNQPSLEQIADVISRCGVTTAWLTTGLFHLMVDNRLEGLRPLKQLVAGGDVLSVSHVRRVVEALGDTDMINGYGPTENTTFTSCHKVGKDEQMAGSVLIGRPINGTSVYILDDFMRPAPLGVAGELYTGGEGLARGYLNRPDITAEKFVPDPFSLRPGQRLYRTGDLARYTEEGRIEFLGRLDHQVKIRGFRVELGEIEEALSSHSAVEQAVVVADQDQEGDKRLVGYIVERAGMQVEPDELRGFIGARLPAYMAPAVLMKLERMPLTENGKIDRKALPKADRRSGEAEERRDEAETQTEREVKSIWEEVLKLERVGVEENFFEAGGHSLKAMQVVGRIKEAYDVDLQVKEVFQEPTVRGLAAKVEEALRMRQQGEESAASVEVVDRRRGLPLSHAQQRIWFAEQLQPDAATFNITTAIRMRGDLDLDALRWSIGQIAARHETLRTRFVIEDGRPLQVIDEQADARVELIDLSDQAGGDRRAIDIAEQQAKLHLDLSAGPLLRMLVVKLDERDHVAVVTMHHIISDGWSMGVLVREVAELYGSYKRCDRPGLNELRIQYADYAAWQSEWMKTEAFERELSYWKRQLATAPPLLKLPTDRLRPEVQTFNGAGHKMFIPAEVADALKSLSRQQGATLFMALMAAFDILIHYHTRENDIVVGTDIAGRTAQDTEGIIGLFVNHLAIRSRLSPGLSFAGLLGQVRDVTLDAYAHQQAPIEKVAEALARWRSLKHSPIFQVKLVLQNTPTESLELPDLDLSLMDLETRSAKLDLTLLMVEEAGRLGGVFEYNTDLFNPSTVARMARHYEFILSQVVATPDASLDEIEERLDESDRRQKMLGKEREGSSLKKFKRVKPVAVTLDKAGLVKGGYLGDGQPLPLVIRPSVNDLDLAEWAGNNGAYIESELSKHGAILFRDFAVETPSDFERFALCVCPDLLTENGEHPRETVSGNIYTPVFYPPDQKLLWHNENSFNHRWPTKILFCCMQPPIEGGETTLADSRRVFELIDPRVRDEFIKKKVMYVRNYSRELGLDWSAVFRTEDRTEVERRCKENLMDYEWHSGDRLRTRCVRPAVVKHPVTGELSWFNQAQHWHISCLDAQTRASLVSLYSSEEMPRHCYYGDGSAIKDTDMDGILDAYRRLEVRFPWQKGDVLVLDNLLAAHARNPYVGERKILVAMGGVLSYDTTSHP